VAEYLSDRGTRVVVIAAPGTPDGLVRCLQARCGLERGQITVVPPASGREEVLGVMTRAAGQATGLLLVWYIGPGALDAGGRLALVTGTSAGPQAAAEVLPFAEAEAALAARRRNWPTLIVLDCPLAGQVVLAEPEWGLLARGEADPGHPAGAGPLTAPLIRLLEHGIPAGPGHLTLRAAHGYLARAMKVSGVAPPRLTGSASLPELILGPNSALSPGARRDSAGSRPRARRRGRRVPRWARLGLALTGLFATTIVLTVITAMLVPQARSAARSPAVGRPGEVHVAASTGAAQLSGVSCTSPTACTAVGNTGSDAATAEPLAERWNGRTWTIQPTPRPAGTADGAFAAVSCTSPTACTAVGSAEVRAGRGIAGEPLAERWNGRTWTIQPTPRPAGGGFSGVSCTSPTACTAVGGHALRNGSGTVLAERWNGRRWTIQPTARLPGTTAGLFNVSSFSGVSCTSATACTAVGESGTTGLGHTPVTSGFMPLAESWNGTGWAIQPMPAPAAATETTLAGVQCTSATACTAVGGSEHGNVSGTVLAERWDGAQWAILPGPASSSLSSSTLDEYAGVSCTSPARCTAVGVLDTETAGLGGAQWNLDAGQWNGTQWAVTTALPEAGGTSGSTLSGVSCTRPAACIAVGQADGVPLAESWNGTRWITQPIGPLPVLYNLGGSQAAAWNDPERRPATFFVFADGSAAVTRMRWARWNRTRAVTSSATYYDRSGPCCSRSDQHYYKVRVTLSEVQYSGGPRPGSYFDRMVIVGRGFRTLTYTYTVSGDSGLGSWTGGAS
jgi:hypothetical protein